MPSGFGELTDQAHDLVSAGDLAGAQRLLADALAGADPRPANATPELAEAASLHARVLVALGEPHSARGWAAFAYAATIRLHGRSDPRTVAAGATLAAVLHRVGSWSRAARLYQEVIIELTASDGPESLRVLAAHADLATVEYARGQCQVARDRLQDAWELHREVYGDGHPSGIKMLARLGAMQRDCGQFSEAQDNLALARDLSRQYLAPDDPLTAQVAALSRAAANPDHVCADTPPVSSRDPVVPAARIPAAGDAPPAPQWSADPADSGTAPTTGTATWPTDETTTAASSWPADQTADTWPADQKANAWPADQAADRWPADEAATSWSAAETSAAWSADEAAAARTWQDPADASATWSADEAASDAGRPWSSPREDWPTVTPEHPVEEQHPVGGYHPSHGYHSAGQSAANPASAVPTPRQPAEGLTGSPNDWWTPPATEGRDAYPSDESDPRTDQSTTAQSPPQPHADRTISVPPSVIGLTGSTPQAPGVYRLRRVDEPQRQQPSRLLPVPVHRPPATPRRPNRMVPIVAAGVIVVLLGTAAVIAGVSRVGGDPGAPTPTGAPDVTATSTTAPETSVSPGAPPTGLALRDNRDSVTLSWEYPAGSEGPVIVSGGRAGQPPSPFADLPAGTDSFVVYGLNRSLDYCFTVAVAWSTDVVARSKQVCTDRS